jgi:hypothetical protein
MPHTVDQSRLHALQPQLREAISSLAGQSATAAD